jgi:hypothetical protein
MSWQWGGVDGSASGSGVLSGSLGNDNWRGDSVGVCKWSVSSVDSWGSIDMRCWGNDLLDDFWSGNMSGDGDW